MAQAADSLPKGFDWKVPGLAIAVVKGDAVGFAKGYGVRKLGESVPVDEKMLFAIGSCSKAFTATVLAMLVDDGKISWDEELSARRMPPPSDTTPAITLKPKELRQFVGIYAQEASPVAVSVELLHGKLRAGQPVATLIPIKPTRFRSEGAPLTLFLEFELADGKVKQVVFEHSGQPKATLLPKK